MFQNQMLVEHSILVSLDAVPALHSSMLYLGMGQAKASSVSAIRGYCSTEGWIVYIWDAGHLDVRSGQEKRCCQTVSRQLICQWSTVHCQNTPKPMLGFIELTNPMAVKPLPKLKSKVH